MAEAAKSPGGLITVAGKDIIFLAPGIMGFENLITPDEYQGELSFKVQVHHNPEQIARIEDLIQRLVIDANWEKWLKEAEKAADKAKSDGKPFKVPAGGWEKPSAAEWLADHLKDPSERSRTQLPSLSWKNKAEYRDKKSGEMRRKVMNGYDARNTLISLKEIKLGMGSTIQPGIVGGLYKSPLIKHPQPSFKLQGVRVLKLIQYGGGAQHIHEVTDEDMVGMEEGFEADDLSGYVPGPPNLANTQLVRSVSQDMDEDDLPF